MAADSNLLDGLEVRALRQWRQGRGRVGQQARGRGVRRLLLPLLLLLLLGLDVPGRRGRELGLEHARVLAAQGHQLHGELRNGHWN